MRRMNKVALQGHSGARPLLSRLERHVVQTMAARARRESRNDAELFDAMLKLAAADAKCRGFDEDRVRYITREFLGEVH